MKLRRAGGRRTSCDLRLRGSGLFGEENRQVIDVIDGVVEDENSLGRCVLAALRNQRAQLVQQMVVFKLGEHFHRGQSILKFSLILKFYFGLYSDNGDKGR